MSPRLGGLILLGVIFLVVAFFFGLLVLHLPMVEVATATVVFGAVLAGAYLGIRALIASVFAVITGRWPRWW